MLLGIDRAVNSQGNLLAITPQGFLVPTNMPAEEAFSLRKFCPSFPRCSDGALGSQVMERALFKGLKTSLSSALLDSTDITTP